MPTASSWDQKLPLLVLLGHAPVKAGHHANPLIGEGRHHRPQIAGSHRDIAVADHEKPVRRGTLHPLQRPNLGIGIRGIAAAEELGPNRGITRGDPPGDLQTRILIAARAKNDLEVRDSPARKKLCRWDSRSGSDPCSGFSKLTGGANAPERSLRLRPARRTAPGHYQEGIHSGRNDADDARVRAEDSSCLQPT